MFVSTSASGSSRETAVRRRLVDAAAAGSGHERKFIAEEEAKFTYEQVGGPEKGWLALQGYYEEILKKTGGYFLQ